MVLIISSKMIRNLLFACLFFSSFALVAQPADRQLSGSVSFEIKEFLLSTVKGSFSDVKGHALMDGNMLRSFEACLPANTFKTSSAARDKNVKKKPEYLDVDQFPTICFTADKIDFVGKIGDETTYDMQGGLTLRNETHPISVRVVQRTNNEWVATFTIDRTQWSVGTGPSSLAISSTVELVAYLSLN